MTLSELYPVPRPSQEGNLAVGPPHEIAWREYGSADGRPVVFLHGGPGSGVSVEHLRFFDPARYRLVAFDQRGAGRSRPLAEIAGNTTADLIADIESLRALLSIESWIVFGGSWGSTLGLAYAEAHPERVEALVLRGVWLCRQRDIRWWLYGLCHLFPEEWRRFAEFIPEPERGDLLGAYHRRLCSDETAVSLSAAQAWKSYESNCVRLRYDPARRVTMPPTADTLAKARIEAHYLVHAAFIEEGQLLDEAGRIRHIPTFAVHGRYDVVCPVENATALAGVLPDLRLTIVEDAGHSALEPGTARELLRIMEALKNE